MGHSVFKEAVLLRQCDGRASATSSRICGSCLGCYEVDIWCECLLNTETYGLNLFNQAIVEHENIGAAIIKGLCDIADALPRVELAAFLYPTKTMKQTVPVLYAHIVNFLVRALEWYEEGKIARAFHSITKPAALRYDDLIEDVRRATRSIADLALISSQAEQRDIHDELRALTSLVKQLLLDQSIKSSALTSLVKQFREEMLLDQSIKGSALLECRQALSEIQLTQGLAVVASQCSIDHKSSFQALLLIRNRHRLASYRSRCTPFWMSPELHAWNTSQSSSLITVQANFKTRFYTRDFCSSVIEQLLNARLAVLWVLKAGEDSHHSVSEILKSLLHQALSFDYISHSDSAFSFQLRRFQDAHFENDYVDLLGSVLEHFKLVYIIVEAGAMKPAAASQCQNHLRELSHRLSERGAATVVKCLTLSYGPVSQIPQPKDSIVLKVGKTSRRKGKKLPNDPFRAAVDIRRQQMSSGRMSRGLPFHTRRRAVRLADD